MESQCTVICGNALDQDFSRATKVFLYLIPRGLRIVLPILQGLGRQLDVVTYMSPFPAEQAPLQTFNVETKGHEGAKWPLWLYKLSARPGASPTQSTQASASLSSLSYSGKVCIFAVAVPLFVASLCPR